MISRQVVTHLKCLTAQTHTFGLLQLWIELTALKFSMCMTHKTQWAFTSQHCLVAFTVCIKLTILYLQYRIPKIKVFLYIFLQYLPVLASASNLGLHVCHVISKTNSSCTWPWTRQLQFEKDFWALSVQIKALAFDSVELADVWTHWFRCSPVFCHYYQSAWGNGSKYVWLYFSGIVSLIMIRSYYTIIVNV